MILCPAGRSLMLSEQCSNHIEKTRCNHFPKDTNRNYMESRSFMDICEDVYVKLVVVWSVSGGPGSLGMRPAG